VQSERLGKFKNSPLPVCIQLNMANEAETYSVHVCNNEKKIGYEPKLHVDEKKALLKFR
jgi:hypothetical protein